MTGTFMCISVFFCCYEAFMTMNVAAHHTRAKISLEF